MWPSQGGRGICGTRGGERRLEVLWHVVSMACMGRWRYRLKMVTHALSLSLVTALDISWMSSCSHLLGGWLQPTNNAIVNLSETNTATKAEARLSNKHFHN